MFDPRDDARGRNGREDDRARVYDERDRDKDPRENLMHDLDLPRGGRSGPHPRGMEEFL